MASRESEKAQRYIVALDNARCQNKWEEVPELVRKITKHAPHRSCLIQVASAEHQVATDLNKNPSNPRPSSAASSTLPELIPSLLSTIDRGDSPRQDIFQAQVCLGWLHWTLHEPGLAVARLPKDFGESLKAIASAGEDLTPWTKVCLVKGCYIKGAAQHTVAGADEALETLDSLTLWLNGYSQAASLNNPQFLQWSEQLVAEGALLAGDKACHMAPRADDVLLQTALRLFRLWSTHPHVKRGSAAPASPREANAKSLIWKSYYDLLSAILRHGLPYTPQASGPARPQLASELRLVESICESNLLREVKFPTASSRNTQVEEWVEQVIGNWGVIGGPQWTDEELGDGGQVAVGRAVLDILYRAATKTYHSHLILRRLFQVHASLADFDLALKALDAYIEIVTDAKERAAKGAQFGATESDGTFVRTLSEAIVMLGCFGAKPQAEKARELVDLIKTVLARHVGEGDDDSGADRQLVAAGSRSPASPAVAPRDLATAYRGIGIGLANWAYWTPVNEKRDDIRAEAIDYLERSLDPALGDDANYSSLYTLAILLAEDRDLDGAVDYVKSALTAPGGPSPPQAHFVRERDLVPMWHLLALLLSAKHDFDIAERSCEAAFEQFPNAVTSLTHGDRRATKSPSSPDPSNAAGLTHALIRRLRGREKERILETRMTQLAFVELVEGPEAAVNHSEQLLGLFAALFDDLDLSSEERKEPADHLTPPKSSAGSTRTFRGSIFGRSSKVPRIPEPVPGIPPDSPHVSARAAESPATTDAPPAIHVSDGARHPTPEGSAAVSRSNSQRVRKRSSGRRLGADPVNGDGESVGVHANGTRSPPGSQPPNARHPLPPIPHNISHDQLPPPAGHASQPPTHDVRVPTSYSFDSPAQVVTKLPRVQSQKHALGLLVKTWLLIAGLYRRASLFDDAAEASEEAAKHVARVEALVAAEDSSARGFRQRGWAVGRSADELRADLYTERGLLSTAQGRAHEAMGHFEDALLLDSDHPKATICLSTLLLDIWDRKLPLELVEPEIDLDPSLQARVPAAPTPEQTSKRLSRGPNFSLGAHLDKRQSQALVAPVLPAPHEDEAKLLNRISARERAHALLSALTKRGSSWDNSEAWFVLSRAYEAEGQTEKLKEVLWWCIELEDRRPIRHWSHLGSGVYVL
ncbi:hypothetical protein P168DRAFT_325808 [Aspergillus campestris IBT 28561]|uniref:Uncharacterized protein n=1 Tax=Aspergillus campestris (strain IBT 28561) TaxID=1392248 RepID=A0A2I1D6F6_ASPC2|nr:uncharacterized protein P168DRAFT_325808 [Aspergillus campestris IBT 28561]PKY05449.1 hypothetical protein P168DRAFT_325808 [Aspergillus campestris IBT 28561]